MQDLIATEEGRNPKWRTKNKGEVYMKDMDDDHLQKAKLLCQSKLLKLHNEMCLFDKLLEQLETEASKRNIILKELDQVSGMGRFFENKKTFKKNVVNATEFNNLKRKKRENKVKQ